MVDKELTLLEIEEKERYQLDRENLRSLQENIDNSIGNKIEKIYIDYLDEYDKDLTMDELYRLRQLIGFIKMKL